MRRFKVGDRVRVPDGRVGRVAQLNGNNDSLVRVALDVARAVESWFPAFQLVALDAPAVRPYADLEVGTLTQSLAECWRQAHLAASAGQAELARLLVCSADELERELRTRLDALT